MTNLNYDEITAFLFEEEELKTMKAVALRRAAVPRRGLRFRCQAQHPAYAGG